MDYLGERDGDLYVSWRLFHDMYTYLCNLPRSVYMHTYSGKGLIDISGNI